MTNKYLLYNSRLVKPGIECSEELLAKFKDGDWLEEGKDFATEPRPVCHGRHSTMELVAVPVQSEGEDEMWIEMLSIFFGPVTKEIIVAMYGNDSLNKSQSQYKLTKR